MDSREPLFLYKETRLNLEPAPSSVTRINIPSPGGANGRLSLKRPFGGNDKFSEEERAYRSRTLASASGVFYRRHHGAPKAFLWRVLEEGSVLSLRTIDVCRQEKAADAPLTLSLHFPAPLKAGCVAFADAKGQDALHLFAIDESGYVHSILLRPDIFRRRTATDGGPVVDTGRPFLPSAFGFKHVHRLLAVNTNQLLATLHDGGVLVLDRIHAHDAPVPWKETFYNSSGWKQGLRNLLPFQSGPTVRYGKVNMELSAATSLAVTSMDIQDAAFIFTVCLDHRMRIWNNVGSILYTGDILNTERNPQEVGKWTIDPSQSNLVRVLESSEAQCLCATYSPIGSGTFKFWRVAASRADSIIVKDAFPNLQLVPPAPTADIWTLADFGVTQSASRTLQLWVLWKNNLSYRAQMLEFTPESIETCWANNWVDVFADHTSAPAPSSGPSDPTDATEKWLQLIFAPGRFTKSTLETALAMYEGGVGSVKDGSTKGSKGLAEAICAVLGSATSLDKNSAGAVDYEQFRATSEIHWRRFYRLLLELDKQRGEALALAVDPDSGLTWVVCADCISAVRKCSTLDRVYYNLGSPEPKYQDLSTLLGAAAGFLDAFSDGMVQLSETALRAELYEDSSKTDYERVQYFSDKAGFWRQVADEDCTQVVDALGENFRLVTAGLYLELVSLFNETEDARTRDVRDPFTDFGRKLLVRGTQETADLHWRILFSQVILLVHMESEYENEEEALHSRFDVGLVYRQLIAALRRLGLVRWLARNELSVPLPKPERSSASAQPASPNSSAAASLSSAKRRDEETETVTALEASIRHLLGLSDLSGEPVAATLTDVLTDICAPDSSIELSPAIIQCFLLKRDRADLALELGAFADQAPFSTYVHGRVCLALRDYDTALILFKRAAVGLSVQMKHADRHSVGLLDDTEWNLLNNGLPNYYSHIAALYERQKAYSYVIDFARLSLQFVKSSRSNDDQSSAEIRTDMLSRLFAASTAISRFDLAHTALLAITDSALQQSCLKRLVEKMCETKQSAEFVALPFGELQETVDRILEQKCRQASTGGVPYHQILYAWRVHHGDFKGAAAVLLDRTARLRRAGEADKLVGDDVLDTPVTRHYLMLINALSCVEPKQAWVVTEEEQERKREGGDGSHAVGTNGTTPHAAQDGSSSPFPSRADQSFEELLDGLSVGGGISDGKLKGTAAATELRALAEKVAEAGKGRGGNGSVTWRRVRSLADLRRDYQDELDRITAIQNNQFAFALGDDAMDES